MGFSLVRKIPNTDTTPNAKFLCGEITMTKYALPVSKLLGERIAAEFAGGVNTVMLENHGVVVGANDLFTAFMKF